MTMKRFSAFINPLAFLEVDEPWAPKDGSLPSCGDVLRYLCHPEVSHEITDIVDRYKQISIESTRLFAPPAEPNILQKLVWPLKYAKSSYMVGNFLGTISLCGMVAEMVAILIFDISNVSINGKPMDEKHQKDIFGWTFERLGQERRVTILRSYDLIDDHTKQKFDLVKEKRRRYLHFFTQGHTDLASDAVKVFETTVSLVVTLIGQNTSDGTIMLNPSFLAYLEKLGMINSSQETDEQHK